MAAISALATNFADSERPAGNLLDATAVLAQVIAAVKFYAGYAALTAHAGVSPPPEIAAATEVSLSEWAIIRPLFLLYVEREQAIQLEASKHMGLDVFGRDSGSVAADISQQELDLPHKAFCQSILTV